MIFVGISNVITLREWHRTQLMLPYGITRPQWVNTLRPEQNDWNFTYGSFKCVVSWQVSPVKLTSDEFMQQDLIDDKTMLV